MDQRDDLELIARFLTGGDREALGALFTRHRSACYGLALHVTRSPEDAEDVCQEAAGRAIRNLEAFEPAGSFRAWLLKITANAARDLVRSRQARSAREAQHAPPPAAAEAPPDRLARSELAAAVRSALLEVELRYRLPVALIYELGLSSREAAAVLDIPEATARTYASRGMEKLRARLGRAGVALAPAAAAGLIKSSAPAILPAALCAALDQIIATVAPLPKGAALAASGSSAGAVKGGIAMKIVVGVVLAGALAGGAALLFGPPTVYRPPPTVLASPPAPAGRPVREHFAYINTGGNLDGPRREAMCGVRMATGDAKDNIYSIGGCSSSLRVARQDGMVETVAGDDFWIPPLDVEEGPASWLPCPRTTGSQGGVAMAAFAARGAPLEGADKGAIYVSTGVGRPDWYYKVWKNKDQGGRWWFKHVMGGGGAAPPDAAGKSAPALSVKLHWAGVTAGADGKLYVMNAGPNYRYSSLYRLDEEKGELVCVLAEADYIGKLDKRKDGETGAVGCITPGTDGAFFVWLNDPKRVIKVSADRTKAEKILEGHSKGRACFDGPALNSGWFDGPQPVGYFPPDILFGTAVDDAFVRRYKDGRISTLCRDGEWREFPGDPGTGEAAENVKDNQAVNWGRGWWRGQGYIYTTYYLSTATSAIYKCGPIDFGKPAIGPLVEGK